MLLRKLAELSYLLSLTAREYPGVVLLLFTAFIFYQGATGKLINRGFGVWMTRKEHPTAYWTILSCYILLALVVLYAYIDRF
jgi:hypothetical protein